MTTCRGARVHPNRQVWASRKWMWRSNEYCCHHHQSNSSNSSGNGSQTMVGGRSGGGLHGGVTYCRNFRRCNRWHSPCRCSTLQMQRSACVLLLVAGHIITWCKQNDHTQRGTCASGTANLTLGSEHRCVDPRKLLSSPSKQLKW